MKSQLSSGVRLLFMELIGMWILESRWRLGNNSQSISNKIAEHKYTIFFFYMISTITGTSFIHLIHYFLMPLGSLLEGDLSITTTCSATRVWQVLEFLRREMVILIWWSTEARGAIDCAEQRVETEGPELSCFLRSSENTGNIWAAWRCPVTHCSNEISPSVGVCLSKVCLQ